MKITLYMAITADGFIAKKDGNSDWVSPVDTINFENAIEDHKCIIVGRKTFDQFQGDLYPVKGVTNIVMTSDQNIKSDIENVHYFSKPINQIGTFIAQKSHDQALLIGGGTTNASFLRAGLIEEIILSVHPLVFVDGIKLFEGTSMDINLELLSSKTLGEGLIQLKYSVKK
ncbi:MAG: dihydrofolate reductase family protein [Candidatus Roizmanbacteria bacterium]|nr:dihydrofolate reductase family protein [Candidatus Roizmanbacteria bacterium]